MLDWTQQSDGWYANGFRIELRAPRHWVLMDVDSVQNAAQLRVVTDLEPLASETTLSQCKREAAILAAARDRSRLRRRHARVLLLTLAATILLFGQSPTVNTGVAIGSSLVMLRSLGIILGTWAWKIGVRHEVFYQ